MSNRSHRKILDNSRPSHLLLSFCKQYSFTIDEGCTFPAEKDDFVVDDGEADDNTCHTDADDEELDKLAFRGNHITFATAETGSHKVFARSYRAINGKNFTARELLADLNDFEQSVRDPDQSRLRFAQRGWDNHVYFEGFNELTINGKTVYCPVWGS